MADDTSSSSLFGGMDFGDILNAALAIYGIKKGQQPPKFYTAPLTPNEQWKSDATKNLFNYASGYTNQYLQGLGNLNPDFKLNTSLAGNPAFMGGIKVPQIDWSKMPSAPSTAAATAPAPSGGAGAGGVGAGSVPGAGTPGYASPFDTMSIPTSGTSGGVDWSSPTVQQVTQFIKDHPNVAKLGVGAISAMLGPAAGAVAGGVLAWLSGHGGEQSLPNQPNTMGGTQWTPDMLAPSGGGGGAPSTIPGFSGYSPGQPTYVPGVGWVTYNPGDSGNTTSRQPPDNYDPMAGASGIAGMLGAQAGGGFDSVNLYPHRHAF